MVAVGDGVIWSAVGAAWVAGLFSVWNRVVAIREKKRRDKGQFKRDDANIAITMYAKFPLGEKKKVEDEVAFYEKILREVKTKREARK